MLDSKTVWIMISLVWIGALFSCCARMLKKKLQWGGSSTFEITDSAKESLGFMVLWDWSSNQWQSNANVKAKQIPEHISDIQGYKNDQTATKALLVVRSSALRSNVELSLVVCLDNTLTTFPLFSSNVIQSETHSIVQSSETKKLTVLLILVLLLLKHDVKQMKRLESPVQHGFCLAE